MRKLLLKTALLASDAISNTSGFVALGNPMAQAIQQRFKQDGTDVQSLAKDWVLKDELSFDVKRKMASYVYRHGGSTVVLSSGAPERVLAESAKILLRGEEALLAEELKNEVSVIMTQMAQAGERLLGFGYQQITCYCHG